MISQPSNATLPFSSTTNMSVPNVSTTNMSVPNMSVPNVSSIRGEMFEDLSFTTIEYLRRYHLLESGELLDIPNLKLLPKLL